MITGAHATYSWLETDHDLREFLRLCPNAVLNRYLAITAVDSGSFTPSDIDKASGWTANGGIAYSPCIQSIQALPPGCCSRDCSCFDEWYIFDRRSDPIGNICHANVFTTEIESGNVFAFVNFYGFSLSDPGMRPIADLFWQQVNWIQPDAYLADGPDRLVFATRDRNLFAEVENALRLAWNDPATSQL